MIETLLASVKTWHLAVIVVALGFYLAYLYYKSIKDLRK